VALTARPDASLAGAGATTTTSRAGVRVARSGTSAACCSIWQVWSMYGSIDADAHVHGPPSTDEMGVHLWVQSDDFYELLILFGRPRTLPPPVCRSPCPRRFAAALPSEANGATPPAIRAQAPAAPSPQRQPAALPAAAPR
jgi:hypothetical protein